MKSVDEVWIRIHKDILVSYKFYIEHAYFGLQVLKETYKKLFTDDQVTEYTGQTCFEFPKYNKDGYGLGVIGLKIGEYEYDIIYDNDMMQVSMSSGGGLFLGGKTVYDLSDLDTVQRVEKLNKRLRLIGNNYSYYYTDGVHEIKVSNQNESNVAGVRTPTGSVIVSNKTKIILDAKRIEVKDVEDKQLDALNAGIAQIWGNGLKVNAVSKADATLITNRKYNAERIYDKIAIVDGQKVLFKNMDRLKFIGENTIHGNHNEIYDFGSLDVDIHKNALLRTQTINGEDCLVIRAIIDNPNTLYRFLYSVNTYLVRYNSAMIMVKIQTKVKAPEWAYKLNGVHIINEKIF